MSIWGRHRSAFITLLEKACSGEDESMGKPTTYNFWINFCVRLSLELNLNEQPEASSCADYARYLRTLYHDFKNPRRLKAIDKKLIGTYPEDEKKKIISIFGHSNPVLSISKTQSQASSSRNTNGSRKRGFDDSVPGSTLNSDLDKALGELVFAGKLKFEDVPEAAKIVTQSEVQQRVFLSGSL